MTIAATPASLREIDDMPSPKGLPLFGNFFQIDLNRFHQVLERWCDELGPVFSFRIGPRRMVAIADPEALKRMFRERPDTFRRTRRLADALAEMRFTGVFSAEGETWRRQRKIVAMALNTAHLKPFYPSMRTTTERLLTRWQRAASEGRDVDLCRDLMRYTVDVTTQLAFGIDFNTLETDGPVIQQQLDKVFPVLNSRINALMPYWRYVRLPRDRDLDAALVDIQARVNDIIADAHRRMAAEPALFESPGNFLEAIIAARQAEGIEFSDADIFGNVCTLLLAGEDTTANTIAWAMNYFIEYPDLFSRARAEVDQVLGDAHLPASVEQAGELPYLEAFHNETMRLKPVAPINAMEPLEDVELLGYRIPRGTVVMMLTRHMATDEARFGHAAQFDPERWLQDAPQAGCPHDTSAYVPFGTGPRFCPGRNLALLEIRTVLAMLCRNFDLRLAPGAAPVEEHLAFTMMPRNLIVRLTARTN